MVGASSFGLVSFNLLFEISTCLLHSGPATKVMIRLMPKVAWDQVVKREEDKEEADAWKEEQ